MNKFSEIFGWYGCGAILLAYAMVSFNVLPSTSIYFQALNLTGALGIVVVSLKKKNYQPALLNAVWAIVAIIAIISIVLSLSKL